MPRVSIIVPAYNAAATLSRTLESVRAQSVNDFEVFVVDDGSTDETPAIAEDFARWDRRFTLIRQKNSGVAMARNAGLARASGPYVTWLDADDIWHPTKIAKQLQVFERSSVPLSFVYTGYRLIDEDDRIIPNFRTLSDISGDTLCRQIATNFFSNVSSIMVPTLLARRFGGHDPHLREWGIEGAEDFLLQLRLSTVGQAACCDEALVGYRMHRGNMSLDNARAARSNLKAIELIEAADTGVPKWVFRLGRARTVGYTLHLLRDKRPGAALQVLVRLLAEQPFHTVLVLALIAHWQIRQILYPQLGKDPELGRLFQEADPETAPWLGHMVLSSWHRRQLDKADQARAARAQVQTSFVTPDLPASISFACGTGCPCCRADEPVRFVRKAKRNTAIIGTRKMTRAP